jgi:hypothetical protein
LSAVLAPTETGQAWRTAVLEDIPDPRLALGVVRGRLPLQDVSRVGAVGELRRDESRGPVLCPGRWGER